MSATLETSPNLDESLFDVPTVDKLSEPEQLQHKPRILLLYGSNRERSFSRLLVEEAARILQLMGAETQSSIQPACRCLTTRR